MPTKTLTAILRFKDQMTGQMTKSIKTVDRLKGSVDKVKDSNSRLIAAGEKVGAKLPPNFEKSRKSVQKVKDSVDKTTSASGKLRGAIDKVKGSTDKLRDTTGKFISQGTSGLGKVGDKFKSVGTGVGSVSAGIGSLIAKVMALVGAVGLVALAMTGIKATIGGAMSLESEKIAMEHFIGLTDPKNASTKTDEFIKFLRNNANLTPFETGEVISTGRRSVNIAGGNIDQAKGLVTLAEDMAALNPGKTLNDAIEALADLKVGETERMKEFGFKISQDQLKKAGGGNVEKGAMAMMNGDIAKQFKGGAQKLSTSGSGLLSTITGSISSGLQDAGIKALEKLKPVLTKVADLLSGDSFNQYVEKLSDGLVWLVDKGMELWQWFQSVLPDIKEFFGQVRDGATKVNDFAQKIGGWITILKTVGIAVLTFKGIMLGFQAYLLGAAVVAKIAALGIGGALTAALGPILLIAAGIALAAGLIYLAWKNNWGGIREKTAAVIEWLKPYIRQAIDFVVGLWNNFVAYWKAVWPMLKEVLTVVWAVIAPMIVFHLKMIWSYVKFAFLTIWDIVSWVMNTVWNVLKTVWGFVAGLFKAFLQFVTGDFSGAWLTLKETVWNTIKNIGETVSEFIGGALDIGKNFIQRIIDGFSEMWGNLKKMATDIWDSLTGIFGKKQTVSVDVQKGPVRPVPSMSGFSRASGLDYVPYDGYQATLHKGERVQTTEQVRSEKKTEPIVINITGNNFNVRDDDDIQKIALGLAKLINGTGGLMSDV